MLKKILFMIFIFSIITFWCYGMAVKSWADSDEDASDDAPKNEVEKTSAVDKSGNEAADKIPPPVEKLLIGQKESPEPEKERPEPKVVDNLPKPPKGTVGPAVVEHAEAQLDRDNLQQQRIAEVESPKFQNQQDVLPSCPQLYQNYPNPFNPETWIPYSLSKESNVIIKIYNIDGQMIRMLDLGHKLPAFYVKQGQAAYWDGQDNRGDNVVSGVYFYVFQAGNFTAIRKMLLIR
jgi:hypothetical protein